MVRGTTSSCQHHQPVPSTDLPIPRHGASRLEGTLLRRLDCWSRLAYRGARVACSGWLKEEFYRGARVACSRDSFVSPDQFILVTNLLFVGHESR